MEVINREVDLRFPSRELHDPSQIQAFVQTSIQAWVDHSSSSKDDVYQVWVINLMVPGFKFQKSATVAVSEATDQIAQNPQRSCALIICPNTGGFGDQYSTHEIRESRKQVEDSLFLFLFCCCFCVLLFFVQELLKDPELRVQYTELVMTFDERTIAEQSNRPSSHQCFMLISDQRDLDGSMTSHFAQSKLWIRGGLAQLPVLKYKDMVLVFCFCKFHFLCLCCMLYSSRARPCLACPWFSF